MNLKPDAKISFEATPTSMQEGQLVLPGEVIEHNIEGLMCGSGVMVRDGTFVATVRGYVTHISQLRSVTPITPIYTPNVGDIVIGRVVQIQNQRWLIHVDCAVLGQLRLSSIYLPNDELRRRTTADERNMRQYFDVGDLVCSEVQQVEPSVIFLHTRPQHPKRLDNGVLVSVPASLIRRVPQHMTKFDANGRQFSIIYGMNGNIWVGPIGDGETGGEETARIRSCLILLGTYQQSICDETLKKVFEETSMIPVRDIVTQETAERLGFVKL